MLRQKLTRGSLICFFAAFLINSFLLLSFCKRTWAPHDDGYMAHVAERLLDGEVLTKDIESRHAGYIHFINAGALKVFGRSLLSLRYPLIILGLLQSSIIYFLFLSQGLFLASFASIVFTVYGYLQSFTPNTHGYCLFLTVVILACLRGIPASKNSRLLAIGVCLGLILLFRQLTAIFLSAGILAYLFTEESIAASNESKFFARTSIVLLAIILTRYFLESNELTGFLLLGVWPFLLLFWAFVNAQMSNRQTLSTFLFLGIGFLLPWIPMLFYQMHHHSLFQWFDDAFIRASRMLALMPYQNWSFYLIYIARGGQQALKHQSFPLVLNGIYWFLLPFAAFLNAFFLGPVLLRKKTLSPEDALPFLAVFYSLVSHTLQIPIYLYYSIGLSLLGILYSLKKSSGAGFKIACAVLLFFGGISLYFQVGQPAQRRSDGILEGRRETLRTSSSPLLSKLRLEIESQDVTNYEALMELIQSKTSLQDPIFAFPDNPELYFLSGRKNPFRFTLLPMGLQSQKDVDIFLKQFQIASPKLVFHNRTDKYNTPFTDPLLPYIRHHYQFLKTIGAFDIYERNAGEVSRA